MKGFETIDITHNSKRTQAGNIEKAGTSYDKVMSEGSLISASGSDSGVSLSTSNVPKNITLESAIMFFRNNAEGAYEVLFRMTADWLDKYRVASRTAMNRLLKEAEETKEDESTLTVDMSEVN